MSDSDDWEKEVDEIVDNKKEEVKVQNKFDDEDAVDSDEERAKEEEKKKAANANAEPARKKNKAKDYDQMFEERHKKRGGIKTQQVQDTSAAGKSKNAKGEELSKAAEEDITDQLFASEIQQDSASLKTQKDYESFANQVGDVLFEGQAHYHIPAFFTELAKLQAETQAQARVVQLRDQMLQAVVSEEVDLARHPRVRGADDG